MTLVFALIVVVLVAVGRVAKESWWSGLPRWARRIPAALIAIAGALEVYARQALDGVAVDWNAVGEAAYLAGGLTLGGVEIAKVLPWAKLVQIVTRVRTWISLGLLVLLGGCSTFASPQAQSAMSVVDTACMLGLVQYGATIAQAELEGVPVEWLAEQLCATPAVYQAWLEGQRSRTPGAGPGAAMRMARARGLVR